jgi:tetratricopeptide (TPR) repeat protein
MEPDPAPATTFDELVERLRLLKIWAGDPSYDTITNRVNAAWTAAGRPAGELARRSTVANCFQTGRRRFNTDLVVAVVEALHPDPGYVNQWRQALRVIGGETEAVAQVRVQDSLPPDLARFTGRVREMDRLRQAAHTGDAVVISAIEGMAGVGKTQLAVHAGHRLLRESTVERVLFVNLRGFHPDASQPPADPAAVLDGFLRLLGVPGQQIPHELTARVALYRDRLAGSRTLVVLDNAASADQVRPLLPGVPGCLAMVTSRRSLAELKPATQLEVDAFTPDEAAAFLTAELGDDPEAIARIAHRCGYLPLALSLIVGHIRATPGWTLADHADRLDDRHQLHHLDSGVEVALTLSYQALPADQQQLLRLAALHPAQDFDAYAVAALTGTDANAALESLCADHLLLAAGPGRYTFHDLVRAFAAGRAQDEDRPGARRDALTRLFDYYLATAAAAMDTLHPTESASRPRVAPARTPVPDLTDPAAASAWLDTERLTLVAVAAHGHASALGRTLYRHLQGGYNSEALVMHGHALDAARRDGDPEAEAHALAGVGVAHLQMGRMDVGTDVIRAALALFRQIGDPAGQAFALRNLGGAAERQGRQAEAIEFFQEALGLTRQAGDRTGEATNLAVLGDALERAGRYDEAVDYCEQALSLARVTGNKHREAFTLNSLGMAETQAGRYVSADAHLRESLELFREVGVHLGEGMALDTLGVLHHRLGEAEAAVDYHQRALDIVRELGAQDGEVYVLTGLGTALLGAGRHDEAAARFTDAYDRALTMGVLTQAVVAQTGLGDVYRALGDEDRAREHDAKADEVRGRM